MAHFWLVQYHVVTSIIDADWPDWTDVSICRHWPIRTVVVVEWCPVQDRCHHQIFFLVFWVFSQPAPVNQSEISNVLCQPIRDQHYIVSTNQRSVMSCVNQSEISIILCQPIREEYLPVSLQSLRCYFSCRCWPAQSWLISTTSEHLSTQSETIV